MKDKELIDIDELREDFQQGKVTCCGMTIQEIMNLKKENEELKKRCSIWESRAKGLLHKNEMVDVPSLQKENEELKKEVEYWKNECYYLKANPEEA